MDIYQSGLNNVQVWISVVPTGATNVRLLSISLMAAVNPAISSQWHVYSYVLYLLYRLATSRLAAAIDTIWHITGALSPPPAF